MNFMFNEKESTPLCEIMGRQGSDKGSIYILLSLITIILHFIILYLKNYVTIN